VVLVLASGRGERFLASGGQGSKLQAPLAGKPVLDWTLAAVQASGLPHHVEDAGHPGMGDSIAAAVRATRNASGWLVLPGDLPLVRPATIRAVADALAQADVVVPTYQGERGHPVGFGPRCGDALAALSGSKGAASVVQAFGATELAVDDDGILVDVDTVDALAMAERLLLQREQRFDVFGRRYLVRREVDRWQAYSLASEGKRTPAGFVIPDFVQAGEIEQYLVDLFHEHATPTNGDVRRIG
jgi:molybdenum cofactor cytidylyltransferase